jgi:hypothetical protein
VSLPVASEPAGTLIVAHGIERRAQFLWLKGKQNLDVWNEFGQLVHERMI